MQPTQATIGYHFGSREVLLTEALLQAIDERGVELENAIRAAHESTPAARERYEAFWRHAIASQRGRSGLAAELLNIPDNALESRAERTVGALQLALMSGILIQSLIDPDHAPSARDIVDGLPELAALLANPPAGPTPSTGSHSLGLDRDAG